MQLENLQVPPYNTTLMGVVRGVSEYYGLGHSEAALYGSTSHAFLINIHEALCPSGPYCWKRDAYTALLANLGLALTDHGFFGNDTGPSERRAVEDELKALLDGGSPCALLNMENQLITGYDDRGFTTTQPWRPHVDFPPAHLAFGSWEELGEEIHLSFFSYAQCEPAEERLAVAAALACGANLFAHPEQYSDEPWSAGPVAYDKWIGAVQEGLGNSHGNWWNGTVWAECRTRAGEYLAEVAEHFPEVGDRAGQLSETYGAIAASLGRASDKELDAAEKVELLRDSKQSESEAAPRLAELAAALDC